LQEDRQNGIDTLRQREAGKAVASNANLVESCPCRDNKRLHLLLPELRSQSAERSPGSLDNLLVTVIEGDEESANKIRVVAREVHIRVGEELGKVKVSGCTLAVVVVLDQG
jgi:hypothetical protein